MAAPSTTPASQPYRLNWPLNASQVESIDQMFELLFRALKNGSINIAITQIQGIIDVAHGGTGINHYAKGDLLYADAIDHLARLPFTSTPTRYLANTGGGVPAWDVVNLSNGVSNRLPFANFVAATAASKLVGRGSAAGAGDFQEITLGSGLTMTGTTLSAAGASSTQWSVLTNGSSTFPELVFTSFGDVIMTQM